MARPPKKIDPEIVSRLAQIHCTMEEIALVVGCSVDTLERRFADIIKIGKAKARSSLRRYQWEAVQKGNTAMLIWMGKQLLDQKDRAESTVDVTARGEFKIGHEDDSLDDQTDSTKANATAKKNPGI